MMIEGIDGGSEMDVEQSCSRPPKQTRALIYTGDLGRPWVKIVEDAVLRDFQRTAIARKDSMPYLRYSPVLSVGEM
ncbi:unnamed protein product [Ascophyllum nodosum]